jgi:hypothetical protein
VARVALAGVFSGAMALAVLNVSVFMAAPVGIILYPTCLILLRVVRPSDLVTGVQVTTEALRRRTRRHAAEADPSGPDNLAEESDGSIVRP